MSAEPHIEQPEQGPISEKTRAILEAIERIDKKVDMIITNKNRWSSALIRSIKQFLSLIEKLTCYIIIILQLQNLW